MKLLKIILLSCCLLLIYSVNAASPNLSQAKKLCSNASMAQKQAAKAAGYDVDEICSSLRNQESMSSSTFDSQNPSVLPRNAEEQDKALKTLEDLEFEDEQKKLPKVERELKKFGYDLFAGEPTTYTPVGNIPVPSNYVVGPGDLVKVQLYGKENESHELEVGRDGAIQFPSLGPIYVSGLSYTELKDSLKKQIKEQIIGVEANISMGELRSIQVFVVGEAYRPGAYTVSSLSTILNALYVSGGVKDIGSLRNIQLKRNGKLVSRLDLYDLLLKGDASGDRRLRSGDVIYIPSVKKTASVAGEVVRPAIYELKNEKNVGQLVELAGGLLPTAFKSDARVERVSRSGQETVSNVNLNTRQGLSARIASGDVLKIYPNIEKKENVVELLGHVFRPGDFKWRPGLKITDVIKSENDVKFKANINAVLIFREINKVGDIKPYQVDLNEIWATRKNFELKARDKILVLSNYVSKDDIEEHEDELHKEKLDKFKRDLEYKRLEQLAQLDEDKNEKQVDDKDADRASLFIRQSKASENREKKKKELAEKTEKLQMKIDIRNEELDEFVQLLKEQSNNQELSRVVRIGGAVKYPGEYPLSVNMTPKMLILLAGGFVEAAHTSEAELTQQIYDGRKLISTQHKKLDLQDVFLGKSTSSSYLNPYDEVTIKFASDFKQDIYVEVDGEVKFPGTFRVARGETLRQLIERVGGFNEFAHPKAAVFSRKSLREHEQKELDELQDRLRQDIAISELERSNVGKTANVESAKSLLEILGTAEATGRLVVDMNAVLDGTAADIMLKDGDKLIVPSYRQEITVVGEVQVATSHVYNPNYDFRDYIDRSGGEKESANGDAIYVVKANGAVILPNQSAWFSEDNFTMEPGDTIVVPLDASRINGLELWSKVSQIVYQIALGAAVLNK